MAHKKAGSSTNNGRDSVSKRLGVKRFAGEIVFTGNILIRQRGTKFHAGTGVKRTSDDTLVAHTNGVISFTKKKVIAFNGNLTRRTFINVTI
jgi:large subunit ribosomal protein L27